MRIFRRILPVSRLPCRVDQLSLEILQLQLDARAFARMIPKRRETGRSLYQLSGQKISSACYPHKPEVITAERSASGVPAEDQSDKWLKNRRSPFLQGQCRSDS